MMIVAGPAVSAMPDGRWTDWPTTGAGGSLACRYVRLRGSADRERPHSPTPGVVRGLAANYTGDHCNSPGARK